MKTKKNKIVKIPLERRDQMVNYLNIRLETNLQKKQSLINIKAKLLEDLQKYSDEIVRFEQAVSFDIMLQELIKDETPS